MLSDTVHGLPLATAARLTYDYLEAMAPTTLAAEMDEVETLRLILIAKNRGRFHMQPQSADYRTAFMRELAEILSAF